MRLTQSHHEIDTIYTGHTGLRAKEHTSTAVDEPALFDASEPASNESASVDEDPPGFAEFWSIWIRKDARKAAVRAWKTATKKHPAEKITAAAEAFIATQDNKQFIPHAATWLNGERWSDPTPQRFSNPRGHQTYRDPADESAYREAI